MSNLVLGLVSVLLATNQPAAISHLVAEKTGIRLSVPDRNDPVEREYQKLLETDDAAQEEADKWIRDAEAFAAAGAPFSRATLSARLEQRFEPVRQAYEDFLKRHPNHARARLAYGSFLHDTQDEAGAVIQWERAAEIDPDNPAAWNNLANYHGHRGPVKKAFAYYEKAIALAPNEPVYFHNLATTTYLFRKDAQEYYRITEPEVFDRSLDLYRKAIKLAPDDFPLASDYAQSYYGIRPLRPQAAKEAWLSALKVANDDIEREGVFIHLARICIMSGDFEEATQHLAKVQHSMYKDLKQRLTRNLENKKTGAAESSAPAPAPAAAEKSSTPSP